jgi:hypothetical protein
MENFINVIEMGNAVTGKSVQFKIVKNTPKLHQSYPK